MGNKQNRNGMNHIFAVILVFCAAIMLIVTVTSVMLLLKSRAGYENLEGSYKAQSEELKEAQKQLESLKTQIEELEKDCEDSQESQPAETQAAAETAQTVYMTAEEFLTYAPGDIISSEAIDRENLASYFVSSQIAEGDEVYSRIIGKSYRENEDIGLQDLRYLRMPHYNFNHEIQVGEMIVNTAVAEDVLNIFRELFAVEYEINSMYLIDNYWTGEGSSSDTASIEVNNTSAFCYRYSTGSSTNLSNHAFGRAIDINPQQNPYIVYQEDGSIWHHHDNASAYVDRNCGDPHVIVKGDACYEIFTKYGYTWGGEWTNPVDYQHFEKTS